MTLILLLTFILSASSLIVEKQLVQDSFTTNFFTRFETFGFNKWGTVQIRGSHNGTGIKVYVCDEEEFRNTFTASVRGAKFCELKDHKIPLIPLDGVWHKFAIEQRGRYSFGLVDCRNTLDSAYRVDLSYILLSTEDGQQIPMGEIQLPYIESVLAGLWVVTFLVYGGYLLQYREFCTPLHLIFVGVMALRLCVFGVTSFFWWTYQLTGVENTLVYEVSYLFFAVAESGFFMVLYFLSKGWRITRTGVPASDFRATVMAVGILLVTLSFFSFYNVEYYFLTLFILYFFVMPKVFSGITALTSRLDHQIHTWGQLPPQHVNNLVTYLMLKKAMLRRVRTCSIAYIFLALLSTVGLKIMIPWWYEWVSTVLTEVSLWMVTVALCFVVRPVQGVFFGSIDDVLPYITVQEFVAHHHNDIGEEGGEPSIQPWDLSKTIVVEWPQSGEKFSLGYVSSYYELEREGNK